MRSGLCRSPEPGAAESPMSIWRQILTALWCALQGGSMAWVAWLMSAYFLGNNQTLLELPIEILIFLIGLIGLAGFSFAALIWVPLLIGAVISTLVVLILGVSMFQGVIGLDYFDGDPGINLVVFAGFLIIPNLAFVVWDRSELARSKSERESAVKAF